MNQDTVFDPRPESLRACTHPSEATLMFGERECLTCGRVALPDTCPQCESSAARPSDNQHCVYDGSLHAWHNSACDECADRSE